MLTELHAPYKQDWTTKNIAAGLLLATAEVSSWEGLEWGLESDTEDEPLAWAAPKDARTSFAWLCAQGKTKTWHVDTGADDALFGLTFSSEVSRALPREAAGSWRPRHDLPLATGHIRAVEIVYDTTLDLGTPPGLVTECLLHGDIASTHLIAAEAYSRDE